MRRLTLRIINAINTFYLFIMLAFMSVQIGVMVTYGLWCIWEDNKHEY